MSLKMEDYSDKTDEELLREYRLGGNPSFLNVLFTRHADVGFRTAMRYMRNQPDAEDVLQLAFIQFLENLPNFREGSSTVKPWLMKMIVNASLCKLREEKRRSQRQQVVASEKFLKDEQVNNSEKTATDREELKNKIKNVVDTLPEKYRSPIWLVMYEGFSYPEVATVLALPEKTVRTQVSRGLEKLKELMGSFGSALSVSLIMELISESKLEIAPTAIKKIIDSPELYKSATSKITKVATHSSRIKAASNFSIFSIKSVFTFLILSVAILGGIFIFNKTEVKPTVNVIAKTEAPLPKEQALESKDTNQTWDFANEKDRTIPLLVGEWEWSSKLKAMASPINKPCILSLPIIKQDKGFIIECLVASLATVERKDLTLNLTGYWAKGNQMIGTESFSLSKKYRIQGLRANVLKAYFYQNYIFSFVDGNLIGARKYSEELAGANVVYICRNYAVQKITSRTFEAPPDELLKAFESVSKQTGTIQKAWKIDATTLIFDQ